jgi:hypothetical protein
MTSFQYRILLGAVYRRTAQVLFGLKIRDVDCDFRLIRRSVLDKIELEYDSGIVCLELVRKLQDVGARFEEVAVRHYPRLVRTVSVLYSAPRR